MMAVEWHSSFLFYT